MHQRTVLAYPIWTAPLFPCGMWQWGHMSEQRALRLEFATDNPGRCLSSSARTIEGEGSPNHIEAVIAAVILMTIISITIISKAVIAAVILITVISITVISRQ